MPHSDKLQGQKDVYLKANQLILLIDGLTQSNIKLNTQEAKLLWRRLRQDDAKKDSAETDPFEKLDTSMSISRISYKKSGYQIEQADGISPNGIKQFLAQNGLFCRIQDAELFIQAYSPSASSIWSLQS